MLGNEELQALEKDISKIKFPLRSETLTYDHNCYNEREVSLIKERVVSDSTPIRVSKNDKKGGQHGTPHHSNLNMYKGDGDARGSSPPSQEPTSFSNFNQLASSNDRRNSNEPILRVAGSLAVSRAIGASRMSLC